MEMKQIALAVVRDLCRRANPVYIAAFEQADFDAYDISEPLVLGHFLAQVFHETGYLTILEENLSYSAKRMTEVWPRRFPTIASAKPFEYNPEALGEKTYGGRMGNTKPGYGFKYRGRGGTQLTSYESYLAFSNATGVDFVTNPDLICTAEYALYSGLFEWKQKGCTNLARKNDIAGVTRRINGGLIGYDDRVKAFDRIWQLVQKYAGLAQAPSWQHAVEDDEIRGIQTKLAQVGYDVTIDGRKGPQTVKAIKAFQKANGLAVDGVCGNQTMDALNNAVADTKAPRAPEANLPTNTTGSGLISAGFGEIGQKVLDQKTIIEPLAESAPILKYVLIGLTVLGVGLIVWGLVGPVIRDRLRPGAPA